MKTKRGATITATYHSKTGGTQKIRVVVLAVWGSDIVAVHKESGIIYATRWEHPKGQTPGQRAKHVWRISERHWVKWERGIFSFGHGIALALARSRRVDIPRYSDFLEECRSADVELELQDGDPFETFLRIHQRLSSLANALKGTSPEVREAREKLRFCVLVHDDAPVNGFRVCIVSVRLKAVNRRFMERIQNLLGWQPKYAARQALVRAARTKADNELRSIRTTLQTLLGWCEHQNGIPKTNIKSLRTVLEGMRTQVNRWKIIRPFKVWAGFTIADVNHAIRAVERQQFGAFRNCLERIEHSVALQQLRPGLEDFLEQVELLASAEQPTTELLDPSKFEETIKSLKQLSDNGWRKRVIRPIQGHLEATLDALLTKGPKAAIPHLREALLLI